MTKIPYPLLNDMIWCLFACEVLGMAVTYIMQFLSVNQLLPCLEAPSWWTNDDYYAQNMAPFQFMPQLRWTRRCVPRPWPWSPLLPAAPYRLVLHRTALLIFLRPVCFIGETTYAGVPPASVTPRAGGCASRTRKSVADGAPAEVPTAQPRSRTGVRWWVCGLQSIRSWPKIQVCPFFAYLELLYPVQ